MASTVWRGRLAFGMVAIPVRMYKAARRERIRFHHVYRQSAPEEDEPAPEFEAEQEPVAAVRQGSERRPPVPEPEPEPVAERPVTRVHNLPVADRPDHRVEPSQILKGFEVEKDRYVVLDPGELKALRPPTSPELAIEQFVRLDELDPLYLDVSYFLEPDGGVEKPYALLYRALAETGYAALGSLAMHGREHAALIRPGKRGLILHTLFYAKEVRLQEEHGSDTSQVSDKELELATTLVNALAAPFDPAALRDHYEERLRALIDSRQSAPLSGAGQPERERAPVVDILEALRRSLAAVKKPPASEPAKPVKRRKKA